MKFFVFIILCFSSFYILGQKENTKTKLFYYVSISPAYSYRQLSSDYEDYQWIIEERNNEEKAIISYHINTGIGYKLNENFSFLSGFSFYNTGWKSEKQEIDNLYKYKFVGIPVNIIYNFTHISNSFNLYFPFSLDLNMIVASSNIIIMHDNTDVLINSIQTKSFLLGLHFGPGISKEINNNICIFLQPELDIFPTSIIDSDINEYLYGFSFKVGLNIKQ